MWVEVYRETHFANICGHRRQTQTARRSHDLFAKEESNGGEHNNDGHWDATSKSVCCAHQMLSSATITRPHNNDGTTTTTIPRREANYTQDITGRQPADSTQYSKIK